MDYKKAYEEALEKARFIKENCDYVNAKDIGSLFEQVFPELGESEDEKIRERLIEFISCNPGIISDLNEEKALSWLEKQKSIEWTSEDEANMDAVWKACGQVCGIKYQGILGDWLKTLRPHENKDNKEYEGGYIDLTIAAIEEYYGDKNPLTGELVSWLENQKWSEEDENNLTTIISEIEANKLESEEFEHETYNNLVHWLKSLKPQPHWRPSDEQIEALEYQLDKGGKYNYNACLKLLDELKTLRNYE